MATASKNKQPSVATPRRSRDVWLRGALAILFALVVIPLGCEVWARAHDYRVAHTNPHAISRRAEIETLAASGESMWKTPNWEYLPNAEVLVELPGGEMFTAHSNRFGFRGSDVAVPRPANVYRIACIGGSTTAEGRSDDQTYPAALQRDLRSLLDSNEVEVVNCGISGINSTGQLRRMLRQTPAHEPSDSPSYLDVQPQLFVEYGAVNDICWLLSPVWIANAQDRAPLRALLAQYSHWIRDHQQSAWQPNDQELSLAMKFRVDALREMAQVARQHGIETAFCTFARPDDAHLTASDREYLEFDLRTTWGSVYLSYNSYCRAVDVHNRLIEELCQQEGYQLIPVAAELVGGLDFFLDICHLNRAGIERKAEIIAHHLADRVRVGLESNRTAGTPTAP